MATAILAPPIGTTHADPGALADHPIYGSRPLLRGRFHQVAAALSVPIGTHLMTASAGSDVRIALFPYVLTCTLMFATSAAYHRLAKGIVARFWMRRLDHSMILIHIAGSTTPIALLGVGGRAGAGLLIVSWSIAIAGATMKMTRLTADNDPCPWCFPLLGWLPLLSIPALAAGPGWEPVALLVIATLTYAAGAVCFTRKSPDPVPTIFGYHEVWHVFTLLAGGFQLLLTLRLAAL